jgi:hypothetical protein
MSVYHNIVERFLYIVMKKLQYLVSDLCRSRRRKKWNTGLRTKYLCPLEKSASGTGVYVCVGLFISSRDSWPFSFSFLCKNRGAS